MSPDPGGVITATGDLFAKVPGVTSSKGVAMNAPPDAILGTVSRMVRDAMATIPASERGQLVAIATRAPDGSVNVNLALAAKVGKRVEILAFVGKSWGEPLAAAPLSGGVAGRVHF